MRLDPMRLATASVVTTAIVWTVCALLVAALPELAMNVTEGMLHADLDAMSWNLTFGSYLVGLLVWSLIAGLCGALLAYTYNHAGAVLTEPGRTRRTSGA